MKRWFVAAASVLLLALTTSGVALAVNYAGEDYCKEVPAWPGGSYLGQMHTYHVDFYRAHAASIARDPCELWAEAQRFSAVRGLREAGYTVFGPGEFEWPVPPEPTPLTVLGPNVVRYAMVRGHGPSGGTLNLVEGVHTLRFTFGAWDEAPVTVTYSGPGVTPTVLYDGHAPHRGILTVSAPNTGDYHFEVQTARDWSLQVGEKASSDQPTVELTEEACAAYISGGG